MIKNYIPGKFKKKYYGVRNNIQNNIKSIFIDSSDAKLDNIYHCCLQRTGSQFFVKLYSGKEYYKRTGLKYIDSRRLGYKVFGYNLTDFQFPHSCGFVIAPLYINYNAFKNLKKPSDNYKCIFIYRDPREIVLSHYYAIMYSHVLMGTVGYRRSVLQKLSFEDGIIWLFNELKDYSLFSAVREWMNGAESDSRIKIFKYEEIFHSNEGLLDFLDHQEIEGESKDNLLKKFPIKVKQEKVTSHVRSGKINSWSNKYNERIINHFEKFVPDLI